ncbi:Autoinducer 2 sensor kinase/phosphatase LuxQ [Pseudoruegeria aquimaris]|uniref:histidine kinase n=1 Tax=Pseudoruegeria aquimaris TaxID=393663 RepID=A0A1Y5SP41_9RHOB|nr:ATP-binding protein [Pseudoruegeria aquimaris]SLN42162.1 Autoinducer 2 sensor kinase/phosphatase LuxQ [Pseudoruegeria aquimaris]
MSRGEVERALAALAASPADQPLSEVVPRRRFDRERRAREEAESLLERKARDLYEANQALAEQSARLEELVQRRTEELEAMLRAAEAAIEAKSAFLATMSHELRTPLNGVLGLAQVLQDSDLPPREAELVCTILDSGEQLLRLLNDLLDASKIEAGKVELERRRTDLSRFLARVSAPHAQSCASRGLRFVRVFEGCEGEFLLDSHRLRQIIDNIIGNALKFTAQGEIRFTCRRVQAPGASQAERLVFEVADTGPGIPADRIPQLFDAFTQADTSTTRRFGGTGLGLMIVRNLCQLMGGDVEVESAPGQGSLFRFWIEAAPAGAAAQGGQEASAASRDIQLSRPLHLLVAEDNRTNQVVLEGLLRRQPVTLSFVEDGAEAVSAFQGGGWDAVLMDVNMPVMDGIEATRRIRALQAAGVAPGVPIIGLTANALPEQVSGYLRAGMSGHIAKPLRKSELMEALQGVAMGTTGGAASAAGDAPAP